MHKIGVFITSNLILKVKGVAMVNDNNILIERLSNRFKISETEIKDSIKHIFSEIALVVIEGKVFYMYDLGFIYVDKDSNLIFRNADIAFDDSLETITNKYFGRTYFYEAMFETIRHIVDNAGIIYIEDFGTFSYKDGYVNFEYSDAFSYLIEERYDKINKITSTILTKKLSSRFKKSKLEVTHLINQLFKKITLSVIDSKVFYIYDIGYIYVDKNCKLVFRSADIAFDESIKDIANGKNKKEMYETILETIRHAVDNGERIYIECFGTFFYESGYIKFEADEILLYVVDKRFNIKKIIEGIASELDDLYSNKNILESKKEKYKSMTEYTASELLDINNFEEEFFVNNTPPKPVYKHEPISKKNIEENININNINNEEDNNIIEENNINEKNNININKKKKKNIVPILIASIFVVAIVVIAILFITYPKSKRNLSYDINNKKLENIVDEYFNNIDSQKLLSYELTSDMHYWDISKELYNDFTYWPLIYSYNEIYKADALIKKGSSINYKDIKKSSQSVNNKNKKENTLTIEDIKYFYNTLSKSFLLLYPNFVGAEKNEHALWTLKLSYYYDKDVFMINSNMIPENVYSDILTKNGGIDGLYSQFSKYNKLNGNIISSFIAIIK